MHVYTQPVGWQAALKSGACHFVCFVWTDGRLDGCWVPPTLLLCSPPPQFLCSSWWQLFVFLSLFSTISHWEVLNRVLGSARVSPHLRDDLFPVEAEEGAVKLEPNANFLPQWHLRQSVTGGFQCFTGSWQPPDLDVTLLDIRVVIWWTD